MRQHEVFKIRDFSGGVTERADLQEGQFSDSLNLIPDRNRSRLALRPGLDIVRTYFGCTCPKQIVGVLNGTCTAAYDELILVDCDRVTHVMVPLDVSCCRTTSPCSWMQCIHSCVPTGAAAIMCFIDKKGTKYPHRKGPDGIHVCYHCSVYKPFHLGRPPYSFAQSEFMMFFMGQGCTAFLGHSRYECSCAREICATLDRAISSSPIYCMTAYCFRCSHCWTSRCWWLNTCSLRLNICVYRGTGFYYALYCGTVGSGGIPVAASSCSIPLFGKPCACWNKWECGGAWTDAGSCFWNCAGCFFHWFYNQLAKGDNAHCWNFAKGCYAKPCWAYGSTPVFIPCYNRAAGCALYPYYNVLTYHKGRVFLGRYEKVNGTFSQIVYHSTNDTRDYPRYFYWRPWDETAVSPTDGNIATIPTGPNSFLTGMVGIENGLVLFFSDRIMLWQWPDSVSPHDFENGARIETIHMGVGAIHQRSIQQNLGTIYFMGRGVDGIVRLMSLDPSLKLDILSDAIDDRINLFDFSPTSLDFDASMFRNSYFMRLGTRIYMFDLLRKAWYPLSFNWFCYNSPIISMAASRITDRLYISIFDCYSPTLFQNVVYVWPQGEADNALSCHAICWMLEFDNIDLGGAESNDKYIRDVVIEVDNESNTCSIAVRLADAQDCTVCATVTHYPTTQRREVHKFEFGRRLKNVSVRMSGKYDSSVRDGTDGKFGIDTINIRWKPRSSVEQ